MVSAIGLKRVECPSSKQNLLCSRKTLAIIKMKKMRKYSNLIPKFLQVSLCYFIVLSLGIFSAYSQQMPKMNIDSAGKNKNQMSDDEEIAHPFFTHMGMPEAVGTYSLRFAALATKMDGKTKADFAFHFETGLSKFVGLHIRNDRFLDNTHTEIMFQFAVIRSKDGMSGFSPIIEFEIPTKKGASRINTLVGSFTALVRPRFAFNRQAWLRLLQRIREKNMEPHSASLVLLTV